MKTFNTEELQKLQRPDPASHKGDNGKVMVIGGSQLFHAASLWSLEIASKIVDMVFYSSVDANNILVEKEKEAFRNGIIVPRNKIEDYIAEADSVLIGPGLPRENGIEVGDDDTKILTEKLLKTYSDKHWVIDGGSLQVIEPQLIPQNAILTPHHQEFERLFGIPGTEQSAQEMARKYHCVVLLKGPEDIVCGSFDSAQDKTRCVRVLGGNAGMTKGGTGDVLAGLTAALYSQNSDPSLVACVASYINKKAGERLFEKQGYYFNASDLVQEIPGVMKEFLLSS